MKTETYTLEFITPCFCAGADQGKAEIRPPSIRGELRWWFRVLGGTPEQEREVFGGVHGGASASKVVVRVSAFEESREPISLPKNLTFFTSSRSKSALPPGSTFRMHLVERAQSANHELFWCAVNAFLLLGCVGLRSGRGLGAFAPAGEPSPAHAVRRRIGLLANTDTYFLGMARTPYAALDALEAFVGEFRTRYHILPNSRNAFGFVSGNSRHAAAIHLRPVRVAEGFLPVVFYSERPLAQGMRGIRRELQEFFAGR